MNSGSSSESWIEYFYVEIYFRGVPIKLLILNIFYTGFEFFEKKMVVRRKFSPVFYAKNLKPKCIRAFGGLFLMKKTLIISQKSYAQSYAQKKQKTFSHRFYMDNL